MALFYFPFICPLLLFRRLFWVTREALVRPLDARSKEDNRNVSTKIGLIIVYFCFRCLVVIVDV